MLAGVLSAQAGFKVSADTYGIINIPIGSGMNSVGISLLPMPGDTAAVQNIVLSEGLTKADKESDADKLYVYNGSGYTIYWLNTNAVWYTTDNEPASLTVAPGNAMWIKAQMGGKTIYQMGTIASAATNSVALVNGNNFIANPFPADLNLATINWDGVAAKEKFTMATADLIRVWRIDGTGYDTFYYVNAAAYPAQTGWYNANTYQKNTEILAGEGFWFVRKNTELTAPLKVGNPFVQ